MKYETEISLGIGSYHALIDQHGMKPRHRLLKVHAQKWIVQSAELGSVPIGTDAALTFMALDALVWLRSVVGYEVETSDDDASYPARLLLKIRNAVDLVLAR